MNVDPWRREFDAALRAVRDAALLARNIRRHSRDRALLKTDGSPVTVADFAVQALVAYRLSEACPNDPLVGREPCLIFSTGRLLVRNRGVIVSNGSLHDAVLDAVRAVATDSPNDANRTSGALS